MRIWRSIGIAVLGGILGATMAWTLHLRGNAVHAQAQEQFTSFAGCVTVVPKSWGNFMGASTYGMAFQDDKGTVRFIQHPICMNADSVASAPTPPIDQEIVRK